jgi:hypothetical protein
MFFFCKKKKIVVDAFTTNQGIHELYPIDSAIKFIPDWWKNINGTYTIRNDNGIEMDRPTIKRCNGFIDNFKTGFIIPLWSDLSLLVNENGNPPAFQWADSFPDFSEVGSHSREQYPGMFNEFVHCKISSPWYLKEKTGINFYFANPLWNNPETIRSIFTTTGVTNFKYQHATNINLLFPRYNHQINLLAGRPMIHIIPMTDNDVHLKTHMVSGEELLKQIRPTIYGAKFLGRYKNYKKITDAKEKSSCPFGFK